MIINVFYLISTSNNHLIVCNVLFLALNPMIFVITEPDITKNYVPHNRDDVKRGEMMYIFIIYHHHPHHTSIFIAHVHHHLDDPHYNYLTGIRDVAMRDIRNQIIIIHKDLTKRFNQLYRILHNNPYLGHQFHLRSWFHYYLISVSKSFYNLTLECLYCIRSYLPMIISCILQIILCPFLMIPFLFFLLFYTSIPSVILFPLLLFYYAVVFVFPIYWILVCIGSLMFLPWYCLSGCIFPKNIELSIAYYRDIFDSNPDLNPPVIIDEMSNKLRSIVDNYTPLPSTISFDYLRFVKETKTVTYTMSGGKDSPDYDVEKEITGSFIEFIKDV